MAKHRFRQDQTTRCTTSGKVFYCTVGDTTFRIESTAITGKGGGKRFYCGAAIDDPENVVMGFGRAEIEQAIDAAVAA